MAKTEIKGTKKTSQKRSTKWTNQMFTENKQYSEKHGRWICWFFVYSRRFFRW